jgi:hypothetical protein
LEVLGIPLVVRRVQVQDPVVVAALEEAVKVFESVEGAAWKLISRSAEEFQGNQGRLKILGLVWKVLDPSRTSRSDTAEGML